MKLMDGNRRTTTDRHADGRTRYNKNDNLTCGKQKLQKNTAMRNAFFYRGGSRNKMRSRGGNLVTMLRAQSTLVE